MTSARPEAGRVLCLVEALAETGARGFTFSAGEDRFAGFVVRTRDSVAGYLDRCPHAGWPLAFQEHDYLTRGGAFIICAGHGALFRSKDGVCVAGPCAGRALAPWPVRVEGEMVVTA